MMTTPQQPTAAELLAFLRGADPLDGVWFGEQHPTERGTFWWRKHLPVLATAPQPAGDEALEVLRELVETCERKLRRLASGVISGKPVSLCGWHEDDLAPVLDRARKLVNGGAA